MTIMRIKSTTGMCAWFYHDTRYGKTFTAVSSKGLFILMLMKIIKE